jgi:tetratricopeptide (TPR) repeat protein
LFDGDFPDLASSLNNLASTLNALGRLAEALPHARAAEEMNRRVLPPGHVNILVSRLHHGRALAHLNRFSAAEPLLLECAEKLLDRSDAHPRQKQRALEAVAGLYEAWHVAEPEKGYDTQAGQWRDRLAAWQASTQPATP